MDDLDLDQIAGAMGDISSFDRKLKVGKYHHADSSDSDGEDGPGRRIDRNDPVAVLEEKNQILMDRLFKSEKELGDMRSTYESVISDNENLKDKKIIELAKKNRALQLQAESLKTKAAKAAEFALELKKENDKQGDTQSGHGKTKQPSSDAGAASFMGSPGPGAPSLEQERKVKEMEKKMVRLRNENQEQKILIEKATRVLEREIGEIVDINELAKDDSTWKGRAQKVELLKAQVKKYKAQLGLNAENSIMTDGGLSVISEGSVFTGRVTHAEKKIHQLGEKKKDDLDKLKFQVDELKEELIEVKGKYKGALARRDTLEKQLKTIKTDFGMKIKMLLDKAENDDKLVAMLKQEVTRLENLKGVKSQLRTEEATDRRNMTELQKLQRDLANSRNEVKCREIELE